MPTTEGGETRADKHYTPAGPLFRRKFRLPR